MGARAFAGLLFLAILTVSIFPEAPPGKTSRVQVPRLRVSEGTELGGLNRATLALQPWKAAFPEVASRRFEELSGGPAGTLLIGAALAAAVALLLAVVFPW